MADLAGENAFGTFRRLLGWRRERRWRLERAAMYAGADVLVLARTKSGRTWLRAMMSHVYQRRYGLPDNELLIFDNLHERDAQVPRIYFGRDLEIPLYLLRQRRAGA